MAGLCLDCINMIFTHNFNVPESNKLTEDKVITEPDICELCGKYKPCVIDLNDNAEDMTN